MSKKKSKLTCYSKKEKRRNIQKRSLETENKISDQRTVNLKRKFPVYCSPFKSPFAKATRLSSSTIKNQSTNEKIPRTPRTPRTPSNSKRTKLSPFNPSYSIIKASPSHRVKSMSSSHKRSKKTLFGSKTDLTSPIEFQTSNSLEEDNTLGCDSVTLADEKVPALNDQHDQEINEMVSLFPKVKSELQKYGIENVFLDCFRLIDNGKLPIQNISFLLWIEVIRWYKNDSTSSMRYMDDTKKFWKLGWRIFGGKFIRFMSGYKNVSQVVSGEGEKGSLKPEFSDINFAIPGIKFLREFTPYGTEVSSQRHPGIYTDTMITLAGALEDSSACLSYDGKKMKQGLTDMTGDVDLLGFESNISLREKREIQEAKMRQVDRCIVLLENLPTVTKVMELPDSMRNQLIEDLKSLLKILGKNAQEIRDIRSKKEYARSKHLERAGEDWRNSKFVYVISALNAFLFDIDSFLETYVSKLEKLCLHISALNGSDLYQVGKNVYLPDQANYCELEEFVDENEPAKTKQRSEKWHQIRKEALVTGSTLYQALGLDSLKKQQSHFEKVICNIDNTPKDPVTLANMKYGTENEINATATLVAKVLPVLYPKLTYHEVGCFPLDFNSQRVMVVSPDGLLISSQGETDQEIAIEMKCPTKTLHTSLPERYVLQCLSETKVLKANKLLYLSWRPDITSVFEVQHNESLFQKALDRIQATFGGDKPKRPTKLPIDLAEFRKEIKYEADNVVFQGEFISVSVSQERQETTKKEVQISDVIQLLNETKKLMKHAYELKREKASEAMVFLCSDLDRNWSKNHLRWSPVCWFPKGYSLTTDTFRQIVEQVHTDCHEAGIHIPAESFDGQWHNIAVRTIDKKPLTLLQLQKDVWSTAEKAKKIDIVKEFGHLNKEPSWTVGQKVVETIHGSVQKRVLICTNNGINVPKTTTKGWVRNKGKGKQNEQHVETLPDPFPSMLDILPEELTIGTHLGSVLSAVPANDLEAELETCNISEEHWVAEIARSEDNQCTNNTRFAEIHEDEINLAYENSTTFQNDAISTETEQSATTTSSNANGVLTETELITILALLKADKAANKKGKWNEKSVQELSSKLSSGKNMNEMTDVDLRVVLRYLRTQGKTKTKDYVPKFQKINDLCFLFGIEQENSDRKTSRRSRKKIPQLSELAMRVLNSKVPKQSLNVSYAEYLWPKSLNVWQNESAISDHVKIEGTEYPEYWFYQPEFSQTRQQLEVRCIDSTHLLTRTRRVTCKGGIEGITNKPWMDVALSKSTFLTLVMVEDIIDPMSTGMAITHFSEDVEKRMIINGDFKAAALVRDIRNWWRSEDEAGIPAMTRIMMRSNLRERLLSYIDFGQFPPPSMYVNGWPSQLWEALLANIDAKSILYALSKKGTYNTRAFSSMMGETFFSELTNQDRQGHGTVTSDEFSRFIGNYIEQMHMRLDTTRTFVYRTSDSTVYNIVDKDDNENGPSNIKEDYSCQPFTGKTISVIRPRDHFFDSSARTRASKGTTGSTVSSNRNAIQKGTLGVRWERARVNESKILLTKKMGIQD